MRKLWVIEHGANAPVASRGGVCERATETPVEFAARAVRAIAEESSGGKSFELVYVTSPATSPERDCCRSIVASAACRAVPGRRRARLTFLATPSRAENQNELFALVDVLQRELAHSRFEVILRFVEAARKGLAKAPVAIPAFAEAQ